ncbi:MAG: hypothetical protein V4638_01805 [Bacteroidota bacterium]
MLKIDKTYASGLLLVFFWQLLVLFYSPFVGATPRATMKISKVKSEQTIKKIQSIDDRVATSGFFVEEVLEEEYHAPEQFYYLIPFEFEFHYVFHLLIDYHAFDSVLLLPPEK